MSRKAPQSILFKKSMSHTQRKSSLKIVLEGAIEKLAPFYNLGSKEGVGKQRQALASLAFVGTLSSSSLL